MATNDAATIMKRLAALFDESGKTLEELGLAMGNKPTTARRAAWQFLHKTTDPRLSMVLRFAKAMNVPIEKLVCGENSTWTARAGGKTKSQPEKAGP